MIAIVRTLRIHKQIHLHEYTSVSSGIPDGGR